MTGRGASEMLGWVGGLHWLVVKPVNEALWAHAQGVQGAGVGAQAAGGSPRCGQGAQLGNETVISTLSIAGGDDGWVCKREPSGSVGPPRPSRTPPRPLRAFAERPDWCGVVSCLPPKPPRVSLLGIPSIP